MSSENFSFARFFGAAAALDMRIHKFVTGFCKKSLDIFGNLDII
ncbi:hypothetical protein [Oscillospiraceae bacterium]|nr:hypothetical protein [Oscillospiraceae bacterium]